MALDLRERARGRRVSVQVVGEAVHGNDAVRVQEQDREDRPLLGSAQPQRAVVADDLERAEDPELDQARTVAAS